MYLCDTRIKISYLIETNNKSSGKNTSFMYKREDYLLQAPDQIIFLWRFTFFFSFILNNSRAQKKTRRTVFLFSLKTTHSEYILSLNNMNRTQKKSFHFILYIQNISPFVSWYVALYTQAIKKYFTHSCSYCFIEIFICCCCSKVCI